jgi:hypothetical protein
MSGREREALEKAMATCQSEPLNDDEREGFRKGWKEAWDRFATDLHEVLADREESQGRDDENTEAAHTATHATGGNIPRAARIPGSIRISLAAAREDTERPET